MTNVLYSSSRLIGFPAKFIVCSSLKRLRYITCQHGKINIHMEVVEQTKCTSAGSSFCLQVLNITCYIVSNMVKYLQTPYLICYYRPNWLTFEHELLCMCAGHDNSSLGTESWDHTFRSRSKVNVQRGRSDLDHLLTTVFIVLYVTHIKSKYNNLLLTGIY